MFTIQVSSRGPAFAPFPYRVGNARKLKNKPHVCIAKPGCYDRVQDRGLQIVQWQNRLKNLIKLQNITIIEYLTWKWNWRFIRYYITGLKNRIKWSCYMKHRKVHLSLVTELYETEPAWGYIMKKALFLDFRIFAFQVTIPLEFQDHRPMWEGQCPLKLWRWTETNFYLNHAITLY